MSTRCRVNRDTEGKAQKEIRVIPETLPGRFRAVSAKAPGAAEPLNQAGVLLQTGAL